jgi:hypothetical protein
VAHKTLDAGGERFRREISGLSPAELEAKALPLIMKVSSDISSAAKSLRGSGPPVVGEPELKLREIEGEARLVRQRAKQRLSGR